METRRNLLRAAVGGFALTASGLFLPTEAELVSGRGALDGDKGGRRGNDRKGRHKKRNHGDKKENNKNEDKPPQGHGPFRSVAVTVHQNIFQSPLWTYTFYYRVKTGLDEYGPWVEASSATPAQAATHRYAPDRYRVGVLVSGGSEPNAAKAFFDLRNLSFGYPQGSIRAGIGLNPVQNNLGTVLVNERDFAQPSDWFGDKSPAVGRSPIGPHHDVHLSMRRLDDSDNSIEFELFANA